MARVRVQEETLGLANERAMIRHVKVRGSNAEIGQAVGGLASSRYGVRPENLLGDARFVRARRTNLERTYPIHIERMRGVARAFDLRLDDDRFDFSILRRGGNLPGATWLQGAARYTPGWATGEGHSVLRRDATPASGQGPLELYVMEWRTRGTLLDSIAVHVDDLLSGAIAGVNAAGLGIVAVGIAAPPTHAAEPLVRSKSVSAVGLHELGLVRLVLDTCGTVDGAQAALLAANVFPMTALARYLVADATGRSFVYETSLDHGIQTIVDGGGDPQGINSWTGDEEPADAAWRCILDLEARTLEVAVETAPLPGRSRATGKGCESAEGGAGDAVRVRAAL